MSDELKAFEAIIIMVSHSKCHIVSHSDNDYSLCNIFADNTICNQLLTCNQLLATSSNS